MSISNVMSSSIFQTGLFDTASAQPVSYLYIPTTGTIDPATPSASIVDISALGNLLSVAASLADGMLQRAATSPGGFATIVAATQLFIDAFNSFLQSGSNILQNTAGVSLGSQLVKALNAQSTAASGDGKSLSARLASVGIEFQAPTSLNDAGQLTIDAKVLQAAFNTDPAGTTSLLTQMIQSVGQLAAQFTGLLVQLENQTRIGTPQSSPATAAANGTAATTAAAAVTASILIAAATSPVTTSSSIAITSFPETGQLATLARQTAVALLAAAGQAGTTAQPTTTSQPAVTGSPATTNQATGATSLATATNPETPSPTAATGSTTTTGLLATTAQSTVTGLPTASEQATAAARLVSTTVTQTDTIPPSTATAPLTAAELLALTALPTVAVQPITTAQAIAATSMTPIAVATVPPTSAGLPTATGLPITTAISTTTTPSSTAAVATLPAAATVAPATAPSYLVNALNIANNPYTAAAIAAYHLVDGFFDTGKNPTERFSPGASTYSEIWPVARIKPVTLDIHA